MNEDPLSLEKQHLAGLLEAIQRCDLTPMLGHIKTEVRMVLVG
jgi:hypothetical protein